jgi:Ca-activated chloride channel homolog
MTQTDPLVTTYALGETLSNADRERIESALANDASLRAEVEAIRASAGALSAALATEPTPELPALKPLVLRRRTPLLHLAAASVAGLLIGGAGVFVATQNERARELAGIIHPPASQPRPGNEASAAILAPTRQAQAALLQFGAGTASRGGVHGSIDEAKIVEAEARFDPTLFTQGHSTSNRGRATVGLQVTAGHRSGVEIDPLYADVMREPLKKQEYFAWQHAGPASVTDGRAELHAYRTPQLRLQLESPPLDLLQGLQFIQPNTETYAAIYDNPFLTALAEPLSTFSVDVDTASYANVRRFLQSNQLPPADAVRIEELVNYFPYHYAAPAADDPAPFRANVELADCPWNPNAKLLRVALKGKEIAREARPPSNLVFLIDVSGSMNEPNKLPLVKQSLAQLVNQLDERDSVSIVVYAGASGLALPPTRGDQKQTILNAINELTPGGSTNGAAGIELAYQLAVEHFLPQGTNRVMLLTDGDFNVGISDRASLVKLIEEKTKTKVYLSVLGFGTGNLKDATMEELAGKGNGNAAYIDSEREAQKVLVEQMSGTLVTIAKDVKLQVEWNPRLVKRYRLIGYENRMLEKQDFNDDKKDAGDIGAGHAVTAIYEIEPVTPASPLPAGPHLVDARGMTEVDPLRYQSPATLSQASNAEEFGTLKLRYKAPDTDAVAGTSKLIEVPIAATSRPFDQASTDFRFACSVAGFGMLVRGSPYRGSLTWPAVQTMAQASRGEDTGGYRAEFLTLVQRASVMKR